MVWSSKNDPESPYNRPSRNEPNVTASIVVCIDGHPGGFVVKKGRHRRFEEARALKRSHDVDLEDLFEDIAGEENSEDNHKPEHDAWADLAQEWESKVEPEDSAEDPASDDADVSEDAESD